MRVRPKIVRDVVSLCTAVTYNYCPPALVRSGACMALAAYLPAACYVRTAAT